ncbi:MAG: ATP-binding protein [Acidobacteriota bacterium]
MPSGLTPSAYALLGLTAIVAVLVAIVAFALMKFAAAARDARRGMGESRLETALLSAALEEAIGKLRAQERATAARAEASERLGSQIVAGLGSGLLVVSRDGTVQIVNPAARRILGMVDEGGAGPYATLLAGAPGLAGVIRECLDHQRPVVRREVEHATPQGRAFLGVTATPLAGSDGSFDGVVCLFSDLTAVVELEEQLRLKETLARLGELTAGLAHEFRNGLATIHGYARLLDPAALPDPARTYVDRLRQETQALGEVVTNFLDFAKPESLRLAPVDLEATLARAAGDLPDAEITLAGAFGTVEGDEVLLRQAFSNLFRNAVEATTSAGGPPRALVTGSQAAGSVQVTVADEGPGLSAEAERRLFQPFFTTKARGTGLGLAVVQKIIVSHNGRVTAANRPGGGAEFRVNLPAASRRSPKP